jgi:hypothetical protein
MKSSNVKKQLQEHALAAVKKSILLNSKDWKHWNLLGVIAASVGMWYKQKLVSLGMSQVVQ